MRHCKSCRFWRYSSECDRADAIDLRASSSFEILVDVADDTGLETRLHTGPDFGCVLHEEEA